jgi:uncharacterized cupin superfamily protein
MARCHGRRSSEKSLSSWRGRYASNLETAACLELGVGDMFSLPPGIETTWHITPPFKEMWVLASE